LPICCTYDSVTFGAQQNGEQFAVGFVVIGYKDDSFPAFEAAYRLLTVISARTGGMACVTSFPIEKRIRSVPGNEQQSREVCL